MAIALPKSLRKGNERRVDIEVMFKIRICYEIISLMCFSSYLKDGFDIQANRKCKR